MRRTYYFLLFFLTSAYGLHAQTASEWYLKGTATNEPIEKILFYSKAIDLGYKPIVQVYIKRGKAYLDLRQYQNAIQDFSTGINLQPKYYPSYLHRGETYLLIKEYNKAIPDFDKVIERRPSDQHVYYQRGFAKYHAKHYQSAISDFTKAISLKSDNHLAYHYRGLSYQKLNQADKAAADFKQEKKIKFITLENWGDELVKEDPDEEKSTTQPAQQWFQQGLNASSYDNKIKHFTKAIENNYSPLADAYYQRGIAYKKQQNFTKALSDYNKAIELDTENANYYNARGVLQKNRNQHLKAIQDYDKAIALKPDHAQAFFNRGVAKRELKQYTTAIQDFNQSLQFCKKLCHLDYYHRGYTHFLNQNYKQAVDDWEQIEPLVQKGTLNPPYSFIEEARQKLKDNAKPKTKRIALLIGNSNYKGSSILDNPINDASDIEIALKNYQFETTLRTDLDMSKLASAISSFSKKIDKYKAQGFHVTALVYFSGHGLQYKNVNYLIPIGFQSTDAIDIPHTSYSDQRLYDHLAEAHTQIVMIDACRNNPRIKGQYKDLPTFDEGLVAPNIITDYDNSNKFKNLSQGSIISFAAAPGKKALNGSGRNSPYVESFLKVIRQYSTLEIRAIFKKLRDDLYQRTNGFQRASVNDDLLNDFYFEEE